MKTRICTYTLLICMAICFSACSAPQTTTAPTQVSAETVAKIAPSPTQAEPASAPTETALPSATAKADQDGVLAKEYLLDFVELGSRNMSQPTHQQAVAYLLATLTDMGYAPTQQPFQNQDGVNAVNIIVEKPGLSQQVIIAGAHFDNAEVGSGIDDNASGVAVLLEAANRIQQMKTPYTIRFVFFDSEETGLEGSTYYASLMTAKDVENTVAMINLDSLAAGDNTYIYGDEGDAGAIRDWALAYTSRNNLSLVTQQGNNPDYPTGTTGDWSDHAAFRQLGIQYGYFEATNWDLGDLDGYTQVDLALGVEGEIWHTEYDTLEYIENTFPGRVDEHLSLFSNVLIHILTEYQESSAG
jgi:hypothetical protein